MIRFDIAEMTKRATNRRRSSITLRPIQPTATQAGDLYAAAYRPLIQAWQSAIEAIAQRYERALPVRDGSMGNPIHLSDSIFDLDSILAAIEGELQRLVIAITPSLRAFAVRAEQIHRGKWRGAVLTATGIDLNTMLGASDVSETVGAFLSRNVGLIRSVSDQTRDRVSDIVLRNYQTRTPLRAVAKELSEAVGISRKRALGIAADQSSKLSARLDEARQEQAGITAFDWASSHKRHPRPWHAARDGKTFDAATRKEVGGTEVIAVGDGPGEPPFCGCRRRAVIDLS